ncbi:MAG: hypothetical protein A2W35_21650 [Chloroflexi bacterium RBG_16_57_11]|nr:MAG: hypothetical protein A2W35_21650 [Chloroflexi bacterium RBG_16_57_11]
MKDSAKPSTTFIIRFWLERSVSEVRWRGTIEHIPSGRRGVFLGLRDLLGYFRQFDIQLNDLDHFRLEGKEGRGEPDANC